ncbi:MAG: hypothetical protein IH595_09095 [Bacteroidales bacterium]|nr:hypothetical protein [Bacteroidales bacterium]
MKRIIFFISFVLILQLFPKAGLGQETNTTHVRFELSIPPIALINLAYEKDEIVSHSFALSTNEVEQVITKTDVEKTWLNYSSIVNPGSTNYITANISAGFLPPDVSLSVFVSPDAGAGAGALGTPVGEIKLTDYPQNLIVNIGSCYTGAGVNKGRLINYVWDNPESYNYFLLYQHGKPISVTYTITSH